MAEQAEGWEDSIIESTKDKYFKWLGATLTWLEDKTGQSQKIIIRALFIILALYLVAGHFAKLVCTLIGVGYPGLRSVQALDTATPDDDRQWLIYWVVYALFSIVESVSDPFFSWFPFYYAIKCALLIWCFLPIKENGSMKIYHNVVRPYFFHYKESSEKGPSPAATRTSEKDDSAEKDKEKDSIGDDKFTEPQTTFMKPSEPKKDSQGSTQPGPGDDDVPKSDF